MIVGISHFLPGGGAGPDASPPEKVYFVLEGELTVIVDGKETVLRKNNSCYIGPNESREIVNRRQRGLHHLRRGRAGAGVMMSRTTRHTLVEVAGESGDPRKRSDARS